MLQVYLLTGFLGSGKTTVLQRLIAQPDFPRARTALLINDAGTLNIDSDFESLAEPPVAEELQLTCYPLGSTSDGSPVPPQPILEPLIYPAPAAMMMDAESIIVTASRRSEKAFDSAVAVVTAEEENLGDLKLFRVPDRVNGSAKAMKQGAFRNRQAVKARFLYQAGCDPYVWIGNGDDPEPASLLLVTKNDADKGLGTALPQGAMTLFEPTSGSSGRGPQLAATTNLRDYARGQDVELEIGESAQVFARCANAVDEFEDGSRKWKTMRATLTNANPHPVTLRLQLGWSGEYDIRFPREKVVVKNGYQTVEVTVPANQTRSFDWKLRDVEAE